MYIKDSNGKPSASVTLMIIAFIIVMLKVLVGGGSISVGSFSYSFGTIDSLAIAAIFGPLVGSYTARRYTDTRFGDQAAIVSEETVDGGSRSNEGAL